MSTVTVGDRVQVIKANPGEERFLNKIGRLLLVADGVRCVVDFGNNVGGTFDISQLKKVTS